VAGSELMSLAMTAPVAGDRRGRAILVTASLVVVLIAVSVISLCVGPSGLSTTEVAGLLTDEMCRRFSQINFVYHDMPLEIRMPRPRLSALVGASLAVSGAVMQGLFRNPLADPGLIGISAGASLGAVAVIVLGATMLAPLVALLGPMALPLAAFVGGLVATLILYRIATRQGRTSVATMLLAGIALAALAMALTGVLVYMADDRQLRDLTFWQLGSLAGATWQKIGTAGPVIVAALAATPFLARGLNALALGEATAGHLGIPVQRLKYVAIISVSAAVGAAVAVSGGIGFVGIVVPHLLRLAIGPDNRYLLPASALFGAAMLLVADAVCRTIVAPAELPIGIITAAVGGPFFLWILLRKRGIVDL
jgi:iron complex transport system permease protein